MRHTTRSAVTLTALLTAMGVLAAGPALATYPPSAGEVDVADVVVTNPEATVEIEGRDWSPDTVVEISYDDDGATAEGAEAADAAAETSDADRATTLGEARTDGNGSFSADVTLPEDVDPESVTFTVAERPAAAGPADDAADAEPAVRGGSTSFTLAGGGAEETSEPVSATRTSALVAEPSVAGAWALVALLLAGVVTLAVARRRVRRHG